MARKILLIDDDRLQHRLVRQQFQSFRVEMFDLDGASTYEEGLEKLLNGDYHACLLDYQLGERDGLQLIREAVARGCRTPIVFLTAESSERIDIEAMNAGALDYLEKRELTPRALERSLRYALKLGDTLEALRRLATRDQLTGLLNRREFDRLLAEEEERARRFLHPVGLLILDIDHFKAVNDTHGHLAGDAVLREVARRLEANLRGVDRCARYGGEEFIIILPETDAAAAHDAARRFCAVMEAEPMPAGDGLTLRVTVSVGAASMPADASTAAQLVAAADQALYLAKSRGRNQAASLKRL